MQDRIVTINMKIHLNDDLVFDDDKNRLNVKYSPEIVERKSGFDDGDVILVDLLTWLKSFNLYIVKIRNDYKLQIVDYPDKASQKLLVSLVIKYAPKELSDEFFDDIDKLKSRYLLGPNWFLSVLLAIFTNTILIPPKLNSIQLYIPENFIKLSNSNSLLEDNELRKARQWIEYTKYPAIYFTHKITVNELQVWLKKNKQLFRNIIQNLPTKRVYRRAEKARFWGKIAWIFKQEGVSTWRGIADKINTEVDRYKNMSEIKEDDILFDPPGEIEIEKYYKRFMESLERVDNKN